MASPVPFSHDTVSSFASNPVTSQDITACSPDLTSLSPAVTSENDRIISQDKNIRNFDRFLHDLNYQIMHKLTHGTVCGSSRPKKII